MGVNVYVSICLLSESPLVMAVWGTREWCGNTLGGKFLSLKESNWLPELQRDWVTYKSTGSHLSP